jgi:hypothetical protein
MERSIDAMTFKSAQMLLGCGLTVDGWKQALSRPGRSLTYCGYRFVPQGELRFLILTPLSPLRRHTIVKMPDRVLCLTRICCGGPQGNSDKDSKYLSSGSSGSIIFSVSTSFISSCASLMTSQLRGREGIASDCLLLLVGDG